MQRVFGGIPEYAVEKWLQREFMGIRGADIETKRADVIENFMYKHLATINAGVDYETAHELAVKADVGEVLKCRALGGRPEWTLDEFLSREPWDELGGKAGLKEQSKKLLTLVAAAGRKYKGQFAPLDPICKVCGEQTYMHMGDRCNLNPIPCKCAFSSEPKTEPKGELQKRTRGFGDDLDPTCEGIRQTYERKLEQIDRRFPSHGAKAIVKKLLGEDVSRDDELPSERDTSGVGVTGEQGGRLLACFLHSLEEDGGSFLDSVGGAAAWLEKQLPKCALFPAAKLCVQKAIKFLPVLEAGLKKAKKTKAGPAGPKLSFSDDEEE